MEVVSVLAMLSTRPPTPPNGLDSDRSMKSTENANILAHYTRQIIATPEESPRSSADYFSKSSERPLKRVDFLPNMPNSCPTVDVDLPRSEKHIRPLPPSKECKASKSILKAYNKAILSDPISEPPTYDRESFPKMLEDITRELARASRGSRLDAYQTLIACLKAYEDIPDPKAMKEKMPLLSDFIRRDLSIAKAGEGISDTQLTIQVLKLLAILLWSPNLADMLEDDLRSFILDKSMDVIADRSSAKTLVNHYMNLLATQDFRPKIMNHERAGRLLHILNEVATHMKGNGILGQRLMVYRRLLTQAEALMVARVDEWMEHLLPSMLSNIKEIRLRALSFGFDAAMSLGTNIQISRAMQDLFNRQSSTGTKFVEFVIDRLNAMIKSKEESLHVPQIWTIPVLFLRSRRTQLEHWEHMRPWLVIIQKCFNSSDSQVKIQSNMAWNRLIFSASPNTLTGTSWVKMLRQPVTSQFDRKSSDKQSRQAKQMALSSYCALLYYAFRPTATHECLDRFWEEYIGLPLIKLDSTFSCQVLTHILGHPQPKPWIENRATENTPIRPEDLPRLDPRWIRTRSGIVLGVLENLLHSADWTSLEDGEAPILQAWRSFIRALFDAGSKEIKVSRDCMSSMAEIMNCMKRFWIRCNTPENQKNVLTQSIALDRLRILIDIAVESLGPMPFTEKRLMQNSAKRFEAIETPSGRLTRQPGTVASPVVYLTEMIIASVEEQQGDEACRNALESILQISLRQATSRRSKIKVLSDMIQTIVPDLISPSEGTAVLWQLIGEHLSTSIASTTPPEENSSGSPQYLGQDYRDVIKMLEIGVQQISPKSVKAWAIAVETINARVKQETGNGGSVLSVVEPLAGFLGRQLVKSGCSNDLIKRVSVIVSQASWPESRKELDRAQKILWGVSSTSPRLPAFNPFDQLYDLVVEILTEVYRSPTLRNSAGTTELLHNLSNLVITCPASLTGILLKRIQRGVGIYIEDAPGHFSAADPTCKNTFTAIMKLWNVVTNSIKNLSNLNSTVLSSLQTLLCSGLRSRHEKILNSAILLWNDTFGQAEDEIEYPDMLRTILFRLSKVTELQLTGDITRDNDTEIASSPIAFVEDPEKLDEIPFRRIEANTEDEQRRGLRPAGYVQTHPNLRSPVISSPLQSSRKHQSNTTPPARLRHNDSQVQFALVESSPTSDILDSQNLTDHQKEVNERHKQDAAALFPDIKSNAVRKLSSRHDLPKLDLDVSYLVRELTGLDEIISPTLPSADMTTFLGSSPTPRLGRKNIAREIDIDGPPSSPPVPITTSTNQQSYRLSSQEVTIPSSIVQANILDMPKLKDSSHAAFLTETPQSVTVDMVTKRVELAIEENDGVHTIDGLHQNGTPRNDPDVEETIYSESEVFVDVPESPGKQSLPNDGESPPAEPIAITSPDEQDFSSDQDEKVAAQLANDIERALSQSQPMETSNDKSLSDNETPKKRRRTSFKLESCPKRRRSSSEHAGIQVVIERCSQPAVEDGMLDCIVVASSPRSQSPMETTMRLKHRSLSSTQNPTAVRQYGPRKKRKSGEQSSRSPDNQGDTRRPDHRSQTVRSIDEADASVNSDRLDMSKERRLVRLKDQLFGEQGLGREASEGSTVAPPTACGHSLESTISDKEDEVAMTSRPEDGHTVSPEATLPLEYMASHTVPDNQDTVYQQTDNGKDTTPEVEHSSQQSEIRQQSIDKEHGGAADLDKREGQSEALTGKAFLERLKQMMNDAENMTMDAEEGREILSTWMDLGKRIHDAERRRGL